ncbi:TVP38/TMEM64 family protein [Haloarcula laminariae]|uniref:TVP38/TMEM64 family protein n=1 Tax=Haloarcula laminariae TaxID=2961577 RepID=UPI0021C6CB74|nr:TVP38/TMEM64 family protein [Halomicroarcula laminariae]
MTDGDRERTVVFDSAAARRGALLRAGALAVGVLLAAAAVHAVVPVADPAWVRTRVAALGRLAPLAFVALQAAQVILAPVPGQLLGGVGGYLFGTAHGTLYSMTGVLLGSAAVFVAARSYGRPYVERVVDADALDRWDDLVGRTGVAGLFVLFLFPTFPDDLLCFVAGLTDIRLRTFLAVVLVGRTPSFLAVAYAGGELSSGQLLPAGAALALLGVATAAVYALRDRLGLADSG